MNTRSRPARRLATVPHLATLYLRWSNRNENGRIVRLFNLGLLSAAAGATWVVWIHRALVAAAFNELQQHTVMIATLAGIVAAVVVSHRRSGHAARAARSWLAALPVSPQARRVEALTLQLVPVIAALVLVSGFCLLTGVTFTITGLPAGACIAAWRSLSLGAFLGAAGGLAVPLPKPVVPYPGSRYVPHRATRGRRPVPSVAGLGIWPIRRMFAMLRPKTLSRTALPLLVMMPLGTTAAAAMVWIGLFGTLIALVFLAMSVVSVTQAARHWLKPLPLSARRLGRVVAVRAIIVMVGIGAVAAWLTWVGGS